MKSILAYLVGATGAIVLCAAPSLHAAVYTEVGDAGQTLGTAQATGLTTGVALTQIFGTLASATDVDLFAIDITNPSAFSATTVNALTGATFLDTSLFLFDSNGRPVYANDDDSGGMSLGSTLPTGNAFSPTTAGIYYLAISLSGSEPVNLANQLLFALATNSTTVRGPNTTATGPLASWDTSGANGAGTTFPAAYEIDLTGSATAAAVPEPSSIALCALGALALARIASKRKTKEKKS